MRAIITAILIILWLFLGWYYKTTYDSCCLDATLTSSKDREKAPDTDIVTNDISGPSIRSLGPITFNWSDPTSQVNDDWEDYQNNLLISLGEEDLLQITGQFRAEESNGSDYKDLGMARAHHVRNLFKEIPDERIELKSELVVDGIQKGSSGFESVSLRTVKPRKVIIETEDAASIYFPYSSTQRLDDPVIEAYLKNVAKRVMESGERIQLTGHTDSTSSSAFNKRLGLKRAHIIRDYLLSIGVNAKQIISLSAGEEQPIADNATKAGRAKNRRTELQIIPKQNEN